MKTTSWFTSTLALALVTGITTLLSSAQAQTPPLVSDIDSLHSAITTNDIDTVQDLLPTFTHLTDEELNSTVAAHPYYRDPVISQAAWWATFNGDTRILSLVLNHPRIDVNALDLNYQTALLRSIRWHFFDVARVLLSSPRINPNLGNREHGKPLHQAVIRHSLVVTPEEKTTVLEIILLLLRHPRIDVNALNYEGESALEVAVRMRNTEIAGVLVQHGALK